MASRLSRGNTPLATGKYLPKWSILNQSPSKTIQRTTSQSGASQTQAVQSGAPGRPKCRIHSSLEAIPSGASHSASHRPKENLRKEHFENRVNQTVIATNNHHGVIRPPNKCRNGNSHQIKVANWSTSPPKPFIQRKLGNLRSTIKGFLCLYGAWPNLVAQATTCGVRHTLVARAT
ncbi:hypothetical protein JCGZ_22686 [Jatropha curcas]|uniref:Uncharacterized protein n=1 Tax=Jatropha curcas TaxID=180498 RepID=A0A067K1R5_JATCU|nr:hypothetical protein JCGZ_22686 [Jatropha curcas]